MRFNSSQQAFFPFQTDIELDLTVNVDSIEWAWAGLTGNTLTSDVTELDRNFPALIDSSRPFLYLPQKVVTAIVRGWGLKPMNNLSDEYWTIDDKQHTVLLQQKPFLRFNLGQTSQPSPTPSKRSTVSITLPYEAIVQPLDYPYAANTTRFIPIRSTDNTQAYMLGRTFLQEAYLTVDYERSKFAIAPALFPPPGKKNILPICVTAAKCPKYTGEKTGLSTTTIAGIAGGLGGATTLLLLALFFLRKAKLRKRRREAEDAAIIAKKESDLQTPQSPNTLSEKRLEVIELDSGTIHESGGLPTYPMQEMPTPDTAGTSEMADESTLSSFGGYYQKGLEADSGRPIIKVFYEMDATPTSTPDNTPTGTMSSGDTLVNTPPGGSLAPPSLAQLRTMDQGHQEDFSPIPKTPLEYYGLPAIPAAAASNRTAAHQEDHSPIPQTPLEFYGGGPVSRTAGQREWTGQAPEMPRVVLIPATPGSPTPDEVERNRWLKGHSGRGRGKRRDDE
jgi:hypothetical protein